MGELIEQHRSQILKRVSIVIATYNRAELVRLTIESILAQTVAPLEVIIVDDGSTDHTREVCAGFPGTVRYIYQENKGVSAARNTGLRATAGEWIAFCDSDDLWPADKLEIQLAVMATTAVSWSITDFSLIDPNGRPLSGSESGFTLGFPMFREKSITPEQHFSDWLDLREIQAGAEPIRVFIGDAFGMLFLGNIVMPSTAIVARELVEKTGFFDETFRCAEDTEFFHRVAALSPLAIMMELLCEHRVGHPSLVANKPEALYINTIKSVERATRLRPRLTAREHRVFREGLGMVHTRLAYARLSALDTKGARQALRAGSGKYVVSRRSISILLASFLPGHVLRALHWMKRKIRALRG